MTTSTVTSSQIKSDNSIDLVEMTAVMFKSIENIGKKNCDRAMIRDGQKFESIKIDVIAEYGGTTIGRSFVGELKTHQPVVSASNSAVKTEELLAWVLKKYNKATREKILSDLTSDFSKETGFDVSEEEVAAARKVVKGLNLEVMTTKNARIEGRFSEV